MAKSSSKSSWELEHYNLTNKDNEILAVGRERGGGGGGEGGVEGKGKCPVRDQTHAKPDI